MLGAFILPHPPIALHEVGHGREREIQATLDAFREAANTVASWNPDVLFIASPHTVSYSDYFHISPGTEAAGDMGQFGAPEVRFRVRYDEELRTEFIRLAQREGLYAGTQGERNPALDHGVMIPLYFLREAGLDCPIVRMGLSGFSPLEHYKLGRCAALAAEKLGRRAVFLGSGDLSHKLKADGPYGFAPEGPRFDDAVTNAMAAGDFLAFLTMDPALSGPAAECGLRAFQIMAGAMDGLAVRPRLLSHEGTFGVGYGIALFPAIGPDESRRFAERYQAAEQARLAAQKAHEDPWVQLARLSLETYIRTGKRLGALPENLPPALTGERAGAFVSLHVRGELRGCIGTISPVTDSVAEEIVRNAVSAGTEDPRFPAVEEWELDQLEYKVDVLGAPEAISSPDALDVKRYGVIVTNGRRRGLLLPDLYGVDTVEEQIDIARRKAGIRPGESIELQRFEVVRHR